jgi:hypothetical protein
MLLHARPGSACQAVRQPGVRHTGAQRAPSRTVLICSPEVKATQRNPRKPQQAPWQGVPAPLEVRVRVRFRRPVAPEANR